MKLEINFDDLAFRSAMKDAVTQLKADGPQLVREETRLFIKEYRRRVPPMASYGKPESAKRDKEIGQRAIIKDINNVATALDNDPAKMPPRLRELVEKNDVAGIDAYLANVKMQGLRNRKFISADELKTEHLKARNRRGRVPAKLLKATTNAIKEKYIQGLFKLLGFNKGSFNVASFALKEKGVPAYVRDVGPLGAYSENPDPVDFYVTLTGRSTVPSAQKVVNEAIVIRAKKFSAEMKRIMSTFARTGKMATKRKSFNT